MVAKRAAAVPRKASSALEGDLFPRGRGDGDVPRVRKRDGTVIFGGDPGAADSHAARPAKRPRTDALARNGPQGETMAALGLSSKRLSIGMTLLALVTAISEKSVELALPAGILATADADEVLVEEGDGKASRPPLFVAGQKKRKLSDLSDSEEDAEDSSVASDPAGDAMSDAEDDQSIRPLHKAIVAGDVVRVAVVSSEKMSTGRWKIVVSCRPSLINLALGVVGGAVSGGKSANILRKGELMWGAIKAIEDHGYVVDFGASIPTLGFLHFSEVDGDKEKTLLVVGSPVEVVILESQRDAKKTRKVVRVSRLKTQVNAAVSQYAPDMSFSALRAGMRVRARVFKVEDGGGVELRVFGVFPVAVDRFHVPVSQVPVVDSSVDARLLYVDAGAKRVGATLLPSLVESRKPRKHPEECTIGHVLAPVTVTRVDQKFGVVLEHASESEGEGVNDMRGVPLFAHVSRVSDERVDKLEDAFRPGMCITTGARIISYSLLDGVVNVDLRSSVLARKALAVHEVKPGEAYDCKVLSHSPAGSLIVAVDGDAHIRGIVPPAHVSDTPIAVKRLAGHSRFKVGSGIRCICLTVDEVRQKVILTSKKSLVASDRPMLSSFSQAQAAFTGARSNNDMACVTEPIFDGCVAAITDSLGVLVVFTGNVLGLVPRSELCLGQSRDLKSRGASVDVETSEGHRAKKIKRMNASGQEDDVSAANPVTRSQLEALFPVGQTVRTRILHVNLAAQRITLSFNLKKCEDDNASLCRNLSAGSFVCGAIKGVDEAAGCLIVSCRPFETTSGKDPVDSGGGFNEDPVDCNLPFEHLSDFRGLSERLGIAYSKAVAGDSSPFPIAKLLVLDSSGKKRPLVTAKSSLIAARERGQIPQDVDEVLTMFEEDARLLCDGESPDKPVETVSESSMKTILRGYVKAALPSGAIVGFLGGTVGFARKSRIADQFVADPSKVLSRHQSVAAVVESIDRDQKRFTLSLRPSDVGSGVIAQDTRQYFTESSQVRETFGGPRVEAEFPIGAIVDSILDASRPYGMVLQLEAPSGAKAYGVALEQGGDGSQAQSLMTPVKHRPSNSLVSKLERDDESESFASAAAATEEHYASSGPVEGPGTPVPKSAKKRGAALSSRKTRKQKAAEGDGTLAVTLARVLDVDAFTGVVDVSLDPMVVQSAGKRTAAIGLGKAIASTVLLVKDEYAILSLPCMKDKTAIGFCLLPMPALKSRIQLYRGSKIQCTGLATFPGRNIVVADWNSTELMGTPRRMPSVGTDGSMRQLDTSKSLRAADIVEGMSLSGKVTAKFPLQANIAIAKGIVGRLHASNNIPISDKDIESWPVGPIDGSRVASFSLPKIGTILSDLTVVCVRSKHVYDDVTEAEAADPASTVRGSGNSLSSSVMTLELSTKPTGAREGPSSSADGKRIVVFVKDVKRDKAGRVTGTLLASSPTTSAFCPAVDSILPSDSRTKSKDACVPQGPMTVPALKIGSPVLCVVTSCATAESPADIVCMSMNGYCEGGLGRPSFYGIVSLVKPGEGIRVELPWLARSRAQKDKHWGLVGLCDVSDDYDEAEAIMGKLACGDVVQVRAVDEGEAGQGHDLVLLTMRKSLIYSSETAKDKPVVKDELILDAPNESMVGKVVRGFVRAAGKNGCYVSIGRTLVARVLLSDLADEFVKEPSESFPPGKLVSGKISSVDAADVSKVQLVLRKRKRKELEGDSRTAAKKARSSTPCEGTVLSGVVKRIEDFGALVELPGKMMALLHKSEVDQDRFIADTWSEWIVGQMLRVVTIPAGLEGKIRVGTKRCYFEAAGLDEFKVDEALEFNARTNMADADKTGDENPVHSDSAVCEDEISKTIPGRDAHDNDDAAIYSMVASEDDSVAHSPEGGKATGGEEAVPTCGSTADDSDSNDDDNPVLSVPKSFDFDELAGADSAGPADKSRDGDGPDSEDDASSGDERESARAKPDRKKSTHEKREKKRAKEAAEREIRAREEALANSPDTPETAEDFERLLMGQPNASHIWIRYMAFRVSLSQLDKARALAERALETIALTEELERVNVWIAYLNLEATFGVGLPKPSSGGATPGGSAALRLRTSAVFRVFDRACQRVTDVKEFHLQAASALRNSQPEMSEEILRRALASFKGSTRVWVAAGASQFTSGKVAVGRQTLERALVSLETGKHVEVILKFAQLEYRHGSAERGRTVFESLVGNLPKRLDLWSVYLDMETGRYRRARDACRGGVDAETGGVGALSSSSSAPPPPPPPLPPPAASSSSSSSAASEMHAALESVRRIYSRCISLDFSTKKTKFVFKRWLEFETETGDKAAQAGVRAKARQYVETRLVPAGG